MANVSSSNGLEKRPKLRFPGFDEPWMESSFDDVGSFYNGLSGKSKDDFGQGSDRFITYMNVYKNTIANPDGCELVLVEDGEHQNRVEYGDILFTQSSETLEEVGLSSVWLHKASPFLNSFCFGFHFKEKGIINPRFIAYGLRTSYMREQIIREGQGATRYNLSSNRLKPIKLVYPSYQEQSKVASLMSCIEKRIEKQQELICTLKKYKRGLNRRLLSQIEESYNCKLGSVCKIIGGGTPDTLHGEYWGNSVEWFTPSEIGKTKYVNSSVRKLSNEGLSNSSAKLLPAGTVLLTTRATLGEMSIAEKECSTNQGFQSLIPLTSRVSSEYLYYMQIIIKPWCEKYSSGNTFREISKSALSECIIPVPEKPQQDKIVKLLSTVDTLIASEEKEASLLVQLKSSLLQQLFI